MPLLIPCNQLQPGMRLTESFFWKDMMMVRAEIPLTAEEVQSLRARFPNERFRVFDPVLDEAIAFEDDSRERQVAQTAQRKISECIAKVETRLNSNTAIDGGMAAMVHSVVLEVLRYLQENPVSAALISNLMIGQGYLSERAGNVFYLTMLLGIAAHDYIIAERRRQCNVHEVDVGTMNNLIPLGMGATLIDLGMLPLQHLYTSNAPLTPEAWAQIRAHPEPGAGLLPEDFPGLARMVVRTHHENLDGSGYPNEIRGEKLHVFTRIVRIADAFEAGTATRAYREAKSAVRILWEMTTGPHAKYYDKTLMWYFARMIQPFPIGSKLKLRSGDYAVVVRYNRENPLAPQVVVAFDHRERRIPNKQLMQPAALGSHPDLIAVSFGGEDLSFLYEGVREEPRRNRIGIWPTLFEAAFP